MGEDMNIKFMIKHNISFRPQGMGSTFFLKKLCMRNKLFLANLWRLFYMGANDQIMQGKGKFCKCIFQESEDCKSENFP